MIDQIVEDYLSEHTIYDLFKCGTCGKQWSDHIDDCFFHDKKQYFDELRRIASRMEKHKMVFEMARRNGYREDCREIGEIHNLIVNGVLK